MKKTLLILILGILIGVGAVRYADYASFRIPNPVATLPSGAIYDGDMVNGVFEGKGRMLWNNGARYEGEFKNGLFHGQGRYEGKDGINYEGEFRNGVLDGQGRYESKDGSSYEGEFSEGHITGTGTMVYSEDEQYTGEMKYSRAHGKGVLKSYGTVYEGEFIEQKYHGKGKFTDQHGNTYTGDFKDGKFHGEGSYITKDGREYQGEFIEGQFTGQGSYKDKEGTHYEGGFKNWSYDGEGSLKDSGGNQHIGTFQHGILSGQGKHILKSGAHYEGEFNYGQYEGKGTFTNDKGDVYTGEFKYGQYHGPGILSYAQPLDGIKEIKGKWRYGRLTETDDKSLLVNPETINETVLYNQQALLEKSWQALQESDSQEIDMYFLGISGDGSEAVFRREIVFTRDMFDETFGTKGKSVALVNARKTIKDIPLATTTSIKLTLEQIAQRMDVENDILFIYMTSHGSNKFEFSLKQVDMSLPDLPAQTLADILAELPIRWKVIVISACYSGGFIPALKNDHTLIMTAASADQTSFGCTDESEFTYFGEAFFKDALTQTNDFIAAFDIAKKIVKEREEAEDYEHSQPQIHNPPAIQTQLEQWRAGLDWTPSNP